MKKGIVGLANEAYRAGDYSAALEYYRQAANKFGKNLFAVNMDICAKQLRRRSAEGSSCFREHNSSKPINGAVQSLLKDFTQNGRALGTKPESAFENIMVEAMAIPSSNGSDYYEKLRVKAIIIADVYMFNFYKDVFEKIEYVTPDNYAKILSKSFDVFIYTTCWKGVNDEEWRGVKYRGRPMKALDAIIAHCKANHIKTVFQSMEDPSNFEYFLPVAEKFDYVFTTDIDCIDRYKQLLGHERVFFGEYGVNPQLNNPIGSRRYIRNTAFFAGSYPVRYKERCEDMEIILDSLVESGVSVYIADRNHGTNSQDLAYPERFRQYVHPPVEHELLQKLHKLFRYSLNFNSIKQSPTMCAMRVYELQAQGIGLISNYARSVFNKFPGIAIIPIKQNLSFYFPLRESLEEYQIKTDNVREVLNGRTSYDVVGRMLANIGFVGSCYQPRDKVVCILCTERTKEIKASFNRQSYSKRILLEERELYERDGFFEDLNISYFGWFTNDNQYGEHYIQDLVNGFKYTDCAYMTKGSALAEEELLNGSQHEYTDRCAGKARSLFSVKKVSLAQLECYDLECSFDLQNGYSTDPFELNEPKKWAVPVERDRFELSVIVPVYNNGRFLKTKCLPSLQKNQVWARMEVLLVDDGSTDQETINAVMELSSVYPNIRIKLNGDGGSGSASRPRNQGIDMASAPLISFLDPDNEICPGGYDRLVNLFREANATSPVPVEFVSGYHVKVSDDVRIIGRHTVKPLSIVNRPKEAYLPKGKFLVVATQSAVLSRKLFEDGTFRFVEKSAGQDTLFGWELLCRASVGAFTGDVFIIYYADRAGSVTNVVDVRYFEKKFILEEAQHKFLRENDLLDPFMRHHFESFFNNWYLKKLANVKEGDREKAISYLSRICQLYGRNVEEFGLEEV